MTNGRKSKKVLGTQVNRILREVLVQTRWKMDDIDDEGDDESKLYSVGN